jgi:hypothetical protein
VIGVFVDMDMRALGFYKNKEYIATIYDLPDSVYPAVSLSGKNLTVVLDMNPTGSENIFFPLSLCFSAAEIDILFSRNAYHAQATCFLILPNASKCQAWPCQKNRNVK